MLNYVSEQKQPPQVFCKKKHFQKLSKIHRKVHVPESFSTLLKMRLWRRCFPMNFAKFQRTPFLQNTSGRLLLSEEAIRRFSSKQVLLKISQYFNEPYFLYFIKFTCQSYLLPFTIFCHVKVFHCHTRYVFFGKFASNSNFVLAWIQ